MIKLTQADILGIYQPNIIEPRELSAFEFQDILSSLIFFQTADSQVNNIQMQTPDECVRVIFLPPNNPQNALATFRANIWSSCTQLLCFHFLCSFLMKWFLCASWESLKSADYTQGKYIELMCKNLQKCACSRTVFICTHSHYYPQECQKIGSCRNEGKIALVAPGMSRIVSRLSLTIVNTWNLKQKSKTKISWFNWALADRLVDGITLLWVESSL